MSHRRQIGILWALLFCIVVLVYSAYLPPVFGGEGPQTDAEAFFSVRPDLINVNTAPEAELCCLPGIGSKRAQAIITYRQEHGPFFSAEDLCEVPGISDGILSKIQDKICLK